MTEFAAHFDVLKKYIKFLKMCFSVNQIDIYRAVIKSSPGPSVFRGKTTNFYLNFLQIPHLIVINTTSYQHYLPDDEPTRMTPHF